MTLTRVGFAVTLGTLLVPPTAGFLAVAAFTNWVTTLAYVGVLGLISYLAVKRHEKYHRAEKYNDQNWKPKEEASRWR